jgi:hypothetical protein
MIRILSLFPEEDILTKEIESWKGFADRLQDEDSETFMKMLNDCYKYSKAINAKGLTLSNRTGNHGPFIFTAQINRMVRGTDF